MPVGGHREAERQLAKGLSPAARGILGAAMIGIGLIAASNAPGAQKPMAVYGVSAFCFVIAIACLTPKGPVRTVAGRVIGAVVFLSAVAYLIAQFMGGTVSSGTRSEPSLLNAILFMVAFGVPGGYYAVRGRWRDAVDDGDGDDGDDA